MKTENELRAEKLLLFERSTGKQFTVKAKGIRLQLFDEVTGINREHDHVCGKEYGNFHVDYCELVD